MDGEFNCTATLDENESLTRFLSQYVVRLNLNEAPDVCIMLL